MKQGTWTEHRISIWNDLTNMYNNIGTHHSWCERGERGWKSDRNPSRTNIFHAFKEDMLIKWEEKNTIKHMLLKIMFALLQSLLKQNESVTTIDIFLFWFFWNIYIQCIHQSKVLIDFFFFCVYLHATLCDGLPQ